MSKFNLAECFESHGLDGGWNASRILSVKRVAGGLAFREECDRYFMEMLTPAEVETFINKLLALLAEPEPHTNEPESKP